MPPEKLSPVLDKPKKAPKATELFSRYKELQATPDGKLLHASQRAERKKLESECHAEKQCILEEARGRLDIEKMTVELQRAIYESLGIHSKLEQNGARGKFTKWLVDALILDNVELVKDLVQNGIDTLIQAIKEMISLEGLKRMAEEHEKSIKDLFSGDSYAIGKSIGGMGFGALGMVKGALKSEIKHAVGNAVRKEGNYVVRWVEALAEKEKPVGQAIGDMGKFEARILRPADCLHDLESLNRNLNVSELKWNFRWLQQFSMTLDNLTAYLEANVSKMWPQLAEDAYNEARRLKRFIEKAARELDELDAMQLIPCEHKITRSMALLRNQY